jgi:hypothetical protein
MSTRIPSSLKWLIDKRARLDAEVQKTRASLANAKKLIKELSALEKDLSAIDMALRIHEIEVDPSLISPIKSHYHRINLPHGELTRCIFKCLRQHGPETPISKTEIVAFIEAEHPELINSVEVKTWLPRSVQYRLRCLYHQGAIKRHHKLGTNAEGLWSLIGTENSSRISTQVASE